MQASALVGAMAAPQGSALSAIALPAVAADLARPAVHCQHRTPDDDARPSCDGTRQLDSACKSPGCARACTPEHDLPVVRRAHATMRHRCCRCAASARSTRCAHRAVWLSPACAMQAFVQARRTAPGHRLQRRSPRHLLFDDVISAVPTWPCHGANADKNLNSRGRFAVRTDGGQRLALALFFARSRICTDMRSYGLNELFQCCEDRWLVRI
ncbi:hypothetical protein GGR74_003600 [Xanthomonas arboricola]